MKISLDFDDFNFQNNRLDLLLKLKEHYPGLKVSLFTIPATIDGSNIRLDYGLKKSAEIIRNNTDWIQIIPHGLTHFPKEFEKADKNATLLSIKAWEKLFKDHGIEFEKGFKAPYWLWNKNVVKVLDKKGYWGAVDRNQPDMLKTKRYFEYNYSIEEPFWETDEEVLKLHGHMDNVSKNDLWPCFMNLMKMPKGEFVFASDLLEYRDELDSK